MCGGGGGGVDSLHPHILQQFNLKDGVLTFKVRVRAGFRRAKIPRT